MEAAALKLEAARADGSAVSSASTSPPLLLRLESTLPDVVVEWRFDQLEQAGVDVLEALRLALDTGFDVGAFRDLVRRGCRAALALRIVC